MVQTRHLTSQPSLLQLFFAFIKMGVTAFGGPAMVAYMRAMAVGKKKWMDGESFKDGVALCQAVPGATAMQMAAYVGLSLRGVRGALSCFIGFCLPAFILMFGLSAAYSQAHGLPAVVSVFSGLRAVIVAVVANATVTFGRAVLEDWKNGLIALISAGLFWLAANPFFILLAAALLGILNAGHSDTRSVERPRRIPSTTVPLLIIALGYAGVLVVLYFFRRELFSLALLMSRIDLIAFGGGFASLPIMFHEIVEIRSWMDPATFLNGIVLGQFTPGPIVITATFVGYMVYGALGAFLATIAIFIPSFAILIGVAPWFDRMRSSPVFNRAVGGVLCSFVGLLFTVTVRFASSVHWDWPHVALAAAGFLALRLKVDILWVVLAGTVISAFVC